MVCTPASVFVVKSWAEEGVGRKRMPKLHFGPSANSQSFFMWVSIMLPKRRWRRMWPHCHTLWPAANLITVPMKCISTDQVSAREVFNNLLLRSQPTISISKWFRPLPGITYDFYSKETHFYSNQTHTLNIWALFLDIMKLREFLSFI